MVCKHGENRKANAKQQSDPTVLSARHPRSRDHRRCACAAGPATRPARAHTPSHAGQSRDEERRIRRQKVGDKPCGRAGRPCGPASAPQLPQQPPLCSSSSSSLLLRPVHQCVFSDLPCVRGHTGTTRLPIEYTRPGARQLPARRGAAPAPRRNNAHSQRHARAFPPQSAAVGCGPVLIIMSCAAHAQRSRRPSRPPPAAASPRLGSSLHACLPAVSARLSWALPFQYPPRKKPRITASTPHTHPPQDHGLPHT